ncbi:related to transmembrane protein 19 [Cephalotrichum gorgonifer]|uniref:Related to transmembrane protein 19 n=1 Tax=Cephalotrichum gorgonifer TaxID=2041049 RepID=A0AAE8MS96_9PEZI|nr:related to transmembrane protein 19 [Cephalotrichum gorgonifer]
MKAVIAAPATLALVYRAWSHKSLTPVGIVAAAITAIAHAYHPWNLPFVLLVVFFLTGTRVTKVKKDVKATLTVPSKGTSGGEVFANSLVATILSLAHATLLEKRQGGQSEPSDACFSWGGDLLVVGIIANYAAVAADTFSSELGILSKSQPRLITSLTLRKVPPGTNGGVTVTGLLAGLLGSSIIVASSMIFLPTCGEDYSIEGGAWTWERRAVFFVGLTLWGTLGSLVDSVLGGLFQRTVKDSRTGKIVEGEGGVRVLVGSEVAHSALASVEGAVFSGEGMHAVENRDGASGETGPGAKTKQRRPSFGDGRPTRVVESGWNLLDNNDVNFLMALTMSVGAMAVAGYFWDVPMSSILGR